jgi:hypothetical protein
VVQVASEQPVILADSKKGDVQECKVVLARYREWLHSVLEFEVAMRDERASFLDNQDALKYGASDIDRSTELWAIEQLLNGLVEIRRPIEEASREIEGYLAAWNIVNRGVQAKHLNVTLPAFKDDQAKSMMTVPVVPQKVEKVSVVVQAVPTKESLKDRKLLAMLGECVKANPAEVLFVTFFEIVKTNRKMGGRGPSRGYNAMMRHALESGLAQKFGWKKVADLEKEFQSAPLTSIVRGDLLRSNGCVQGNLVLSRTTIPLPWAVYDLFTDEEVTRFIQLINKK